MVRLADFTVRYFRETIDNIRLCVANLLQPASPGQPPVFAALEVETPLEEPVAVLFTKKYWIFMLQINDFARSKEKVLSWDKHSYNLVDFRKKSEKVLENLTNLEKSL